MTTIIFPSEPYNLRSVDPEFGKEFEMAKLLGFNTALVDLVSGSGKVPPGPAIYRGWMFTASAYAAFFENLRQRNVCLINDPKQYEFCHQLPAYYDLLTAFTPKSVWIPIHDSSQDISTALDLATTLGPGPAIVKDYVKSQKHYWHEACFIPEITNRELAERITQRFLQLQGPSLEGGLVFRKYVPLKIVGYHPKSGIPMAIEIRSFWADNRLILVHNYWGDLTKFEIDLPMSWMEKIASQIPSRFFTMDVALGENDEWIVIELGDGQVSDVPPSPELTSVLLTGLSKINESTWVRDL